MGTFRLKQIGLVLCLMASLITAAPAACACSHHEEAKVAETDCHSQHETPESAETVERGNAFDESCICAVAVRTPIVASKSEGKKFKVHDSAALPNENLADLEYSAAASFYLAPSIPTINLLYSSALRSLLPARAPPRL